MLMMTMISLLRPPQITEKYSIVLCHQVHGVDDGGETEGGHQGEVDTPGGHKVNQGGHT